MRSWGLFVGAALCLAACRQASSAEPPAGTAKPPAADAGSDRSLSGYVGFSSDGLLFAYTEPGPTGESVQWLSATTNTVEKTSPLTTPEGRLHALAELQDEGFPPPGEPQKIPPQVRAELRDGQVSVIFGPVPAARPFKPFADQAGVVPDNAQIVAVSKDGKRVAVRVTGKFKNITVLPEYRVVSLFE